MDVSHIHSTHTDGAPVKEFGLLQMWLHLSSGRQLTTFVKRDGTFVLHGVPAGTHLLSIDSPTYMFPQLRVDIDPQRNGLPTVMLADDNAVKLQEPLVIRPAALASFFEERKAFNVVGFLKSPMGIIGGAWCGVCFVRLHRLVGCLFATPHVLHIRLYSIDGAGYAGDAQAQARP